MRVSTIFALAALGVTSALWLPARQKPSAPEAAGSGCPTAQRVKLQADASIRLLPEDRPDVAFRFAGGPRAGALAAQIRQSGEWCVVTLRTSAGHPAGELSVVVPRRIRQCVVESRGGSVVAKYLSSDVQASTLAGNIEMDGIEGSVEARTGGGSMTFGSVSGNLRALTGGGMVRVQRVNGDGVIESAGGEIVVDENYGRLRLSTDGGNIRVGRAARSVVASSSGGAIQIGSADGVDCDSGAGGIRLTDVSGRVRAATLAGHVVVSYSDSRPAGPSFISTAGGDITVFLPSKLAVTVKALSEAPGRPGRVVSEFSELRGGPDAVTGKRAKAVQGKLNGGGPELNLTATGVISLRRLK